jgi:hypothetical protein
VQKSVILCNDMLLLVNATGWYRTKRPMQLRPFSDLLCSPSELQFSALVAAQKASSEEGRNFAKNVSDFSCKYLCSYL